MIDSDQHEKIKNYIELFQVELFYSSDLYYDTALLYNQNQVLSLLFISIISYWM